jgi:fatty acid elongase 3
VAFVFGGRSGLPVSRSSSSLLILVRASPSCLALDPGLISHTGFVYFASWTYFVSTYWQWLPNYGQCSGEEFAAIAGMSILSSYLFLFISFYFATYRKDGKRPTGRKAVRRMSQAPLPDAHQMLHPTALANGTASGNGHAKASGVKTNGVSTRSRKA